MKRFSPLLPLTALALAGMAGGQATPSSALPTGITWTLTGLTEAGRLVAPGAGLTRPTLRLDGRVASGSTGCNVYRAPYALRADVLRFARMATTRRACPERAAALEARFVNGLAQVTGFSVSGPALTLFAGTDDRLVFTAGTVASGTGASGTGASGAGVSGSVTLAPPTRPEVSVNLDGNWTLSGGTALRPVAGSVPSLSFSGGRVTGSGGCNRLNATVRASGDTLTFGTVSATRMACSPAVNAQEQAFLTFLGTPGLRVSVQGPLLTLTAPGGQAAGRTLVFRRAGLTGGADLRNSTPPAPAPSTRDGTYRLSTVGGQPAPRTVQPVTLSLEGNRVGGSDGCNSFGGEYRLDGTRLRLTGPLVGTLRACPEPGEGPDLQAVLRAQPALSVTATGLTLRANGTTLTFTRDVAPPQGRVQTWVVAPQRVPCTGVGPMSCLRIGRDGGSWELFYSSVEGFTFQPGVTQVIRVREENRPAPVPADASSKRHVLVEVVERR